MSITIVAAADLDRVIGLDNRLPWHLPADLKRFRSMTTGKAVIMGRLTHQSIGKPLPQRLNIVLSRDPDFRAPGCEIAGSLAAAVDVAAAFHPEVMVIGGAQLYREALPLASRIQLTVIHERFTGDAWFPIVSGDEWMVVEQQYIPDPKHNATYFDLRRGSDLAPFAWPLV